MTEALILLGVISLLALVRLNFLATIAVKYGHTLQSFQRNSQFIIIWLIPFLGASTVLYFVCEHSPQAIPKKWVPWPFRSLIFGRQIAPGRNRAGVDGDSGTSGFNFHNDGGADGGGD